MRVSFPPEGDPPAPVAPGGWWAWRETAGGLLRLPEDFHRRVWSLLRVAPALVIGDQLDVRNRLDGRLARADTTPGERSFALQLDDLLHKIPAPEYRQLSIEALLALCAISRANPALRVGEPLVLDVLLGLAVRQAWGAGASAARRPGLRRAPRRRLAGLLHAAAACGGGAADGGVRVPARRRGHAMNREGDASAPGSPTGPLSTPPDSLLPPAGAASPVIGAVVIGRPRLNAIAGPIFGEFLLGMSVGMAGLWLASTTSDAAAGAFGLAQQMLETLFVVFRVLAIGLGVVITQALGGGQGAAAQSAARAALGACTWAGLFAAGCVLFGHGIALDAMNAPAAVLPLAAPFLVLLAPAVLLEGYNLAMASILRAHLHVRESLLVMVAMHGCHLLLAVLLMRGVGSWPGLGLAGFALAMLVSRALGLALHLWLWRRRLQLVPLGQDWWRLRVAVLTPVLRIGLPGAALELVYRLAFMVSLAATARLGVEALATHAYTLQLLKYVLLVSLAIGWATEIMVGRLVGGGRLSEADALVRKGVRNGLLASGGLALAAALAAPWLMRAFTQDPAVIEAARTLLWLSLLLESGRVFNLVVTGALRASGDAVFPAASSMASLLLVMGLGSFWFGRWFGLPGIWIAYSLDEWVRGLVLLARWRGRGWLPHARAARRRLREAG